MMRNDLRGTLLDDEGETGVDDPRISSISLTRSSNACLGSLEEVFDLCGLFPILLKYQGTLKSA